MSRSNTAEVRNPILALPEFEAVAALPPESKGALVHLLRAISADARVRAEKCWRTHKGPMALYWKCVAVYTGHIARAIQASGRSKAISTSPTSELAEEISA